MKQNQKALINNSYETYRNILLVLVKSVNIRATYSGTLGKKQEHILNLRLNGVRFYSESAKSLAKDYNSFLNKINSHSNTIRNEVMKYLKDTKSNQSKLLEQMTESLNELLVSYSSLSSIIDFSNFYREHLNKYKEKYLEIKEDIDKTISILPQKYLGLFQDYTRLAEKLSNGEDVFYDVSNKHDQLVKSLRDDFGIDMQGKPAKRISLKYGLVEAEDIRKLGLFRSIGINLRVLLDDEYKLGFKEFDEEEKRLLLKFFNKIEKRQFRFELDLKPIADAWQEIEKAKSKNKNYRKEAKHFFKLVKSISYSSKIERATGRKVTGFKDTIDRFIYLYKSFGDDVKFHAERVESIKVIGGIGDEQGFRELINMVDEIIGHLSKQVKSAEDLELKTLSEEALNTGLIPEKARKQAGL